MACIKGGKLITNPVIEIQNKTINSKCSVLSTKINFRLELAYSRLAIQYLPEDKLDILKKF